MTTPAEPVRAILGAHSRRGQIETARRAGILDREALEGLLDTASEMMAADPGTAGRLTYVVGVLCESIGWDAGVHRSLYQRAQTHAIGGDLGEARRLIEAARAGFMSLGLVTEALRTNLGLLHVLNELGLHAEALEAGQQILTELARPDQPGRHPQISLMVGLAHQNRAVCFESMGRYPDALEAATEAEKVYFQLEAVDRLGEVANNKAVTLKHLGRVTEALGELERAAEVFARAGSRRAHAQTLANLGETHLIVGHYVEGLEAFTQARTIFESLDSEIDLHLLLLDTADAYLSLNLYAEALDAYREAEAGVAAAGMTHHRARACRGTGNALAGEGRLDEADAAFAVAAELFAEAGNMPLLCSVLLEQADLLERQGDHLAALDTAERAAALVDADGSPLEALYARLRLADLHLPDPEAAEPHLREAERLVTSLPLPHLQYRLNQRLGRLRLLQGRVAEAQAVLEEAVAAVERLRMSLPQEALRTSFLRDKISAYEDLIRLHLDGGEPEGSRRALAVADRAKSRTLVDLLSGVIGTDQTTDGAARAQLESLRADLDAVYNQAHERGGNGLRRTAPGYLTERAVELEQRIRHLQVRSSTSQAVPNAAALRDAPVSLPPGTAMISYHLLGRETIAFCHYQDRIQVVRSLIDPVELARLIRRLNSQLDRFRSGRLFAARHAQALTRSANRVLGDLYRRVMEPVLAALDGTPEELVIIPHGPLHQIPFHALYDQDAYLLDRFRISYAPSATVDAMCQRRRTSHPGRSLVLAVPDARIPGVAREAEQVASHLDRPTVLVGEEATMGAFEDLAPRSATIHLACHGLFRAENPMFSAFRLADRWVTAGEVMRLRLPASVVTLSACESGSGRILGGDEIIGLTRAFLGAGAAAVVVSLWLVEDEAAALLMGHWYRLLAQGTGAAAALGEAQRRLRELFPHPYYWAPYVLVGRRS
ncbi:MAG: CHAT domain-containing protein [Acidimicrobiia bacterium]|nr:CHAT domain-containing protein [Acidimicrobiia bacterium]